MSSRTTAISANPPKTSLEAIRSPGRIAVPGPASATMPATSWPGVKGRSGRTW